MLNSIVCLMLIGAMQFAPIDTFKKEMAPIQNDVNDAVNSTGARTMGDGAKASYLNGYGIVVVVEVMFEQAPNPFSSSKTPDQVRAVVSKRRKQVEDNLRQLLKSRVTTAESLGPAQSMAVILHLLNTTRADVPNLPGQIVFSVKKDAPGDIDIREF